MFILSPRLPAEIGNEHYRGGRAVKPRIGKAIDTVWGHMKHLPAVTLSRITVLPRSAWSKAVENKSRFVGNDDMAEDHAFDAYLKV